MSNKPKKETKEQEIKVEKSFIEEGIRYKLDPRYIETKSKQINSLIQPST